jgi:hypothetical protein
MAKPDVSQRIASPDLSQRMAKPDVSQRIEPVLKAEPVSKVDPGLRADTVAEAWLALLASRGVEYLFANSGTDFAPVAEAFAKSQKAGAKLPKVVITPHENLGVAMAHGYTMVTGRPQAMMVHVGVGTANALNGLINASRQNVPILFTAGRTPLTESGAVTAARNHYIHWAQNLPDEMGFAGDRNHVDMKIDWARQLGISDEELVSYRAMPESIGSVFTTLFYMRRSYEEGLAAFGWAGERFAASTNYAVMMYEGLRDHYGIEVENFKVHAYAEEDHGREADYLLRQVAVTAGQQRRVRRVV